MLSGRLSNEHLNDRLEKTSRLVDARVNEIAVRQRIVEDKLAEKVIPVEPDSAAAHLSAGIELNQRRESELRGRVKGLEDVVAELIAERRRPPASKRAAKKAYAKRNSKAG